MNVQFSDEELELLSWFIGTYWDLFLKETEGTVSESALHRLAKKLGLDDEMQ